MLILCDTISFTSCLFTRAVFTYSECIQIIIFTSFIAMIKNEHFDLPASAKCFVQPN